jgi:DNA-binding PadR family transcriptional regulator
MTPSARPPHSSPLALTVLLMLLGGPLHPYEMQRRMRHWGKERVVNLSQRTSLYRSIDRLHEAGLIAIHATEREQRFPERTVYELTRDGFATGRRWLADMLATPRNEFPEFPAALSFVFGLTPDEVRVVLERRAASVGATLAEMDAELAEAIRLKVPRVTLLDAEYLRRMTAAELAWLSEVVDDLRTSGLTWSGEELAETTQSFLPD